MKTIMCDGVRRKRTKTAVNRSVHLDDDAIRQKCVSELAAYDISEGLDITDKDDNYINPLEWWKTHEGDYPILSRMAKAFLAIPATSAPSERIWSRVALILTTKRANLDPEVASGMMFVRENLEILRKHYDELTKDDLDMLSLELSGLPFPYVDWKKMDAGQDMCDLIF